MALPMILVSLPPSRVYFLINFVSLPLAQRAT